MRRWDMCVPFGRLWCLVLVLLMAAGGCADCADPDAAPMVDAGSQREDMDAGHGDGGAEVDAGVDAGNDDAGDDSDAGSCAPSVFDGVCDPLDAATCLGGQCWFGACVGAVIDDDRYSRCGDGSCAGCEALPNESLCPADCAAAPTIAPRDHHDPQVLTVFVHGIQILPAAMIEARTYGAAIDGEGMGAALLALDPDLADGRTLPDAARQLVGVEYYGTHPDPALSHQDVAWIEEIPWNTPASLGRYARIVAAFVEQRLQASGARTVNLLCHSMGCHVTRFLIEHDLRGLSSSGRLARFVTLCGALQGARMARMINNPLTQDQENLGAINIWDVVHIDPAAARAHVAAWDHDLQKANNPTFRDVLIHSFGGSDQTFDETFNLISLGALDNPDGLPHDGLIFTMEAYFHDQATENRPLTSSGSAQSPTHGILHMSHNELPRAPGAALVAHAALFGRRYAFVTVDEITVIDDHEGFLEMPPAEVAVDSKVFVDTGPGPVLIDERSVQNATAELVPILEGETGDASFSVYGGPLPEGPQTLGLRLSIVEVDNYKRFGIDEAPLFPTAELVGFEGSVELRNHAFFVESASARARIVVRVEDMP